MDLQLKDRLYLVSGASSGFGEAIACRLHEEGASVIAIARGVDRLDALKSKLGDRIECVPGDITQSSTQAALIKLIGERPLSGALINAGGPPAKSFLETELIDWDEAYQQLLRWKVELTKVLLPLFARHSFGRMLFIESSSVKQPLENLVLSTSLRLAVVGFVKTLAVEVGKSGVTANILAPGYHLTPAVERVFKKRAEVQGISYAEAQAQVIQTIPAGNLGEPADFASLAAWLLSPLSRYVTGQTISVEGGSIRGIFG